MPSIPPDLYKRLRDTLLRCGPFDSDENLRAVFIDSRIAPWKNRLPGSNDAEKRVDAVIELLLDQHTTEQENVLVLLLHALSDRKEHNDDCYRNFLKLAFDLEDELKREETQQPPSEAKSETQPISHRIPPKLLERLRYYLSFKLYNDLLIYPSPDSEAACITHLNSLLRTVLTYQARQIFDEARPAPDQVQGKWVNATLLFADVTGFTELSRKLSARGRAGAEEITKIVNEYFKVMVQELHQNGGFVLKFGGDALLGMFVGVPESTARSAVQAALNMQREMIRFADNKTSAGIIPLQMKVGLHTGPVFATHVGTPSQIVYWITGENVNFTAIATEAAAAARSGFKKDGQVVGSTETTKHLTAWGDFQHPSTNPNTVPPITPSLCEKFHLIPMTRVFDELQTHPISLEHESYKNFTELIDLLDTLTPYLPKGLLPRLVYNPHKRRIEGEHRLAAVLFINVDGFSELASALGEKNPKAVTEAMQDYFTTVQTIVDKHGGTINKVDLYHEGDKVLAIFGAPTSHEDDADQAARAALEIQVALKEVNTRLKKRHPDINVSLRQRIGLSTGFVFSGNVGPDICQEYTIMGDNVNLAARLMSKADWHEILVSQHAYYWLSPFCTFAPNVKELNLKGFDYPVSAYQLTGLHTTYRPQPEFVDRITTQEILQEQIQKLVNEEGQIAITRGEPGIGKSRLWAKIKQETTEAQKACCLTGRCRPQGSAYQLFAEILREHLGLEVTDNLETQRDRLIQKIEELFDPEQVNKRAPFLSIVMDLPLLAQWEESVSFLGEQLPARLAEEIAGFFKQLARDKPLLLICEDLQWLNEYTAPILLKVMELVSSTRIMLGLTLYPGVYPIYERIANKARNRFSFLLRELSITPLEPEYCSHIVHDVLGKTASKKRLDYIFDRSQGNPLLVVEITRAVYADPAIEISPSVYHMIESRIDSLPEKPKETLKAAAIIGTEFSIEELLHITKTDISGVLEDLSTLRGMHLITKQARNYHFVHSLTQEVVYNSQNLEKRQGYHQRLADYWEYEHNAHNAARHYFAAELWDDALRLGELAADEHLKNYAYTEAIKLYELSLQAAQKAGSQPPHQRLNHQLGEVCYMAGRYEKAEKAFNRELGFLLIQAADGLTKAEVHAALGEVYDRWGKFDQALVELDQGLRLAGSAPTITRAQLLRVRCSTLRSIGEHEKAIESGKEAIEIARTVGSLEEEAYANNNLGAVYGEQGQIPSALACHQRALQLRRELGDRYGEEQSLNNVALCYIFMGQVEQAEATFAEALKIQQEIGDRVGEGSTHHSLGKIDCMKGQLEAAEAKFQQALEIWGRIDYRKGIAFVHHDLGADVYAAQNRWNEAQEHLEAAITAYEEMGIKPYLPEAYSAIAPVYRELGLISEALMAEQKACDGAPKAGNSRVEEEAH